MQLLTPRWTPMRDHDEQIRLVKSRARFNVVPSGRRSGKTEIVGKRKLVLRAINSHRKDLPHYYRPYRDPRFFVAAPTRDQVKRIYWNDLKALIPRAFMFKAPNESQLVITLLNGAEIHCLGMDKPERAEGTPWDYGVLDEYANMKERTWTQHIRPALSDRMGGCDFIGVPEGRNHYYDLYKDAQARAMYDKKKGVIPEWDAFHWFSADILPESEIIAAKKDLDELTFLQEYCGDFIHFSGRAYYNFLDSTHTAPLTYDPRGDLLFCFDFNVSPGVAVVVQEQHLPVIRGRSKRLWGSGVIGEVWIPRGSNTIRVCKKLIHDWGTHQGRVFLYGDATGGARGSAKVMGTDWQLIKERMWAHFGSDRVFVRVKSSNPPERARVNSVNSRLLNTAGEIRLMVDPTKAPHVVKDLEGVVVVEGGSGEIDKASNPELSHLCFGTGTLVDTDKGSIPIEELPYKGKIRTWNGSYVDYIGGGVVRGIKEVVELSMSDGTKVECTPDHLFLTSEGWKKAVDCYNATCYMHQIYRSFLCGKSIVKEKKQNLTVESIVGMVDTSLKVVEECIETFGNIITGLSQKVIAFITSTMIQETMIYPTLNACLLGNIDYFITNIEKEWQMEDYLSIQQLNGIEVKKAGSGTESMQGIQTLVRDGISECVQSVEIYIKHARSIKGSSVQGSARQLIGGVAELMMSYINACIVEKNSEEVNISNQQSSVPIITISNMSKKTAKPVYCPTVVGDGCFSLSNGVIVSNSDALGYYVWREYPVKKQYRKLTKRHWK